MSVKTGITEERLLIFRRKLKELKDCAEELFIERPPMDEKFKEVLSIYIDSVSLNLEGSIKLLESHIDKVKNSMKFYCDVCERE